MTYTVVTSGNVVSGATLNNGDVQQITQAGSASDTVINSGGEQDVFGHRGIPGTASGSVINSGGYLDNSAGAISGTTVNAGGELVVENNATASNTTVSGADATMLVVNNAVIAGVTVNDGAVVTIGQSGSATNAVVNSGGHFVVSGTGAGATTVALNSGAHGLVSAGGTLSSVTVNDAAILDVAAGGGEINGTVSSGGLETVEGSTANTLVSDGGLQILRGGSTTSVTVGSGGQQVVSAGGNASATQIGDGGQVTISSGGYTVSVYVNSNGVESVLSGGIAAGSFVFGGGTLNISSGGVGTSDFLNSGVINVQSGGLAADTQVSNRGTLNVSAGALATDAVLFSGTINDAGTVSGGSLRRGVLQVLDGGSAVGFNVSGGTMTVYSGATATGTVLTGGTETVLAGASETGATVTGGTQNILGTATATTIAGGTQNVYGYASGTALTGGNEFVRAAGTVSGTTAVGGTETVEGLSLDATFTHATQAIAAGGTASGATIGDGAYQAVAGTAVNTTVSSRGGQSVSGVAINTVVMQGATEEIVNGGVASGTQNAGNLVVSSGSTVSAVINSGGVEYVLANGTALATTISSGGLVSAAGGTVSGAIMLSGAVINAFGGGVVSSTTVFDGGTLNIYSGGTAADTTISGGNEIVFSGGIDLRAIVSSGSVLTVASSGVASATMVLDGANQAVLLSGTAQGAILSGGTQTVSSAGIARATQVLSGGAQTVLGGAQVSGTMVSSGGTQLVSSGGVASATVVTLGGFEVITSGGLALNATVSSGGTLLVSSGATATGTLLSAGGGMINHGNTSATSGAAISGIGGDAVIVNDGYILGASLTTGIGISVAGGTVTNAGTIIGLNGTAIAFGGSTTNRLIVTSASVISGLVSATTSASNTLELTGSNGVGGATLANYTAKYLNFQNLQIDSGSTWEVSGTNNVGALINDGMLLVNTGDVVSAGNVTGSGGILVSGSGRLELDGSVAAGQVITFSGISAKVIVTDLGTFAGTVGGFSRGDIIDLSSVTYAGSTATMAGNVITVTDASANSYTINLSAAITDSDLKLSADANNKLQITLSPMLGEYLGNDTGISPTDTITSDATLIGHTDPNATVELRENGTLLGTATANNAGNYSYASSLADGTHTLVATVTDPNGFTATRTSTFTLDTTAPVAPTVALTAATDSNVIADGITNFAMPALTDSGETGDAIVITDGGVVVGTTTVASGTWTVPLTASLADGSYTLLVTQTDVAGNSSTATLNLTIDTTAPAAPAIALAPASDSGVTGDLTTNVTQPSITGTGTTGDTIKLYDNGVLVGSGTVDNSGNFAITPTAALTDGVHPLTVTETDVAGNASAASTVLSLTIDTTPDNAPTTLALAPADDTGLLGDDTTTVTQPHITGAGVDGDTVALYDSGTLIGTGTVANGTFSILPNSALTVGSHTLTAVQTDPAGNVSTASSSYTLTISDRPPAPVPVLAAADDSGVQGDQLTNVVQPAITGAGGVGDTITLYEGNTVIGTAVVAQNGTFSVVPTTALADGVHTLTLTATDGNNNVSNPSSPFSLTIDTAADVAPAAIALDPADDTGSAGDLLTNITQPSITGTAVAGNTVELYDSGVLIGSATVGSNGNFAVTPSAALADGIHPLTVVQIDPAGNASVASSALNLAIDHMPDGAPTGLALLPTDDTAGLGDGITSVAQPHITGNGVDGSIVSLYDGATLLGTATVANGTFSIVPASALADGTHTVTATQTDPAGNVSPASTPYTLVIDTTAPTAPTPVLAPASDSGIQNDNVTDQTAPAITGTGSAGDTVTLYEGNTVLGTAIVGQNGTFSVTPATALADGVHNLTVTATDLAGNVSAVSQALALTIDPVADPAPIGLTLASNSDSGITGDRATNIAIPTITGTATAGDTVELFEGATLVGSAIAGSNGSFAITPATALADGTHQFTARVTDAAGNVSALSAASNITILTALPATPPAPTLDPGSDSSSGFNETNVNTPLLVGTGTAGDTVTVYNGATVVGTATVTQAGTYTMMLGALPDGDYSLVARQTDYVGNQSAVSQPLVIRIDTQAPASPAITLDASSDSGLSSSDHDTSVTHPVINGTAETGSVVTLYDGNVAIGTATAVNGTFSITPSLALANGVHSLQAVATDLASNASAPSAVLSVNIDTIADPAPTQLALAAASDSGIVGDRLTNVTTPVITGRGVANHVVTLYNGATAIGTATVASNGRFSITPSTPLTDGLYNLTVKQTDVAGNQSAASAALSVTVDTVADAAPSAPALEAASDSGTAADGLTNVAQPTVVGTGVAGDAVTLYDGATVVGTGPVDGSGNYAITLSTALADGGHRLSVTQTDAAGNISLPSIVALLTVDTTPPPAPTPALSPASDSATLGDAITNVNLPAITGTGTPGDIVSLYDGNALLGTAVVAANGTFSVTPQAALSDGTHALRLTATDPADNQSTPSTALSLLIDTTPDAAPTILSLSAATDSGVSGDGLTNHTSPAVTGFGAANHTVTLYEGTTVLGTAVVGSNGRFTITPTSPLAEGVHNLTARQTDLAGNVSPMSQAFAVTIDTIADAAPTGLTLLAADDSGLAADNLTNQTQPTITGTGVAGSTATLFDGGTAIGSITVAPNGSFALQPTVALVDGLHNLTVVQTDPAGNTSAASAMLPLTIDTTPPIVTAPGLATGSDSGVLGDGLTNITTPTITGTGQPGATVSLRDGTVVLGTAMVGQTGNYEITPSLPLAAGLHNLTITATDTAGNVSAASPVFALTVQTTTPTAPGLLALAPASDTGTLGDGLTSVTTPTITGTGTPGNTVTLLDGATVIGTALVDNTGTWSLATTPLANGTHTLTAQQTDPAANTSAPTSPLALTVQSTTPTAPGLLALAPASDTGTLGDGLTSVTTPTITGTGTPGNTVTLLDGATVIGTALVDNTGTWSLATTPLANGTHTLTAQQTDPAANTSAPTSPLALTVQSTTPTAPGLLALAPASDTGTLGDGLTSVTTPTITGTGTPGNTVTLLDGATVIGTALVDNTGTWSLATTPLANGTHTLTAQQTDPAANTSAPTSPLALTVQSTTPTAPGLLALAPASDTGTLGDGLTSVTTPTITGTGTPGNTVTLLDGATVIGTALVDNTGTWSLATTPLANGTHTLTAQQTDPAANTSAPTSPLALTVQSTTPIAPGLLALAPASDTGTLGDGLTSVTTPTITGTGTPGNTVTLLDGATVIGTALVGNTGTWSLATTPLANGTHTLTAQQTDPAANTSPPGPTLSVGIDANVPTAPTVGQQTVETGAATPILSGTAETGSAVRVYQNGALIGNTTATDGTWSYAYPTALAAGQYRLTATATNSAGTTSASSAELVLSVAADNSYSATVPSSDGTKSHVTVYSATGVVDRVDTLATEGQLLTSVTSKTALINIYDTAGTLIGTIVQPSTSAFHHPVFDTEPDNLAASTASGQTGSVVDLLFETNNFVSEGNDIITVHSGTATVSAMGPTTEVTNIAANLTFYGNNSATKVYGGSGTITAIGGTAGATIIGGTAGNNLLVAGGGTSMLVAVANGDVLFGSTTGIDTLVGATGNVTLVAGAGTETLVAHAGNVAFGGAGQSTLFSGAQGNSILVGGSGTSVLVADGGNEEMWGGSGNTTIWGGSGRDVMGGNASINSVTVMHGGGSDDLIVGSAGTSTAYGGKGNDTFWSGSGSMTIYQGNGNDIVGFGTGATTVYGGAGANLYAFIKGVSGGEDIIHNFKVGTDTISLTGYDPATVTTNVTGGSTIVTLSDHTRITLVGVTQLTPGSIA